MAKYEIEIVSRFFIETEDLAEVVLNYEHPSLVYCESLIGEAEFLDGSFSSVELVDCPNHNGSFDCSPFCVLCAGNQEIKGNAKLAGSACRCADCSVVFDLDEGGFLWMGKTFCEDCDPERDDS